MTPPPFQSGVYRHFKGGLYYALGLMRDATSASKAEEAYSVRYRTLDGEEEWHRPYAQFFDNVERPKYAGPRFTYVKELSDEEVLALFGWTLECESPLEIRHDNGAFASGEAASCVIYILRDDCCLSGRS